MSNRLALPAAGRYNPHAEVHFLFYPDLVGMPICQRNLIAKVNTKIIIIYIKYCFRFYFQHSLTICISPSTFLVYSSYIFVSNRIQSLLFQIFIVYLRIKSYKMTSNIYTFRLDLTMKLMNEISKVDRFDASWAQIEKRGSNA